MNKLRDGSKERGNIERENKREMGREKERKKHMRK
jgi:hypothetical protein